MVQLAGETNVDAGPRDHRAHLADPLPGHPRYLWVRLPSGDSTKDTLASSVAIRYQPCVEPDLHSDPVRNAEPATCSVGYSSGVGHDYLDDHSGLATLSLDCLSASTLFCVGVAGNRTATINHLDELGSTMICKVLTIPLAILMGAFVMAEETTQPLFNFTGTDAAREWQIVNDGVMGGVSQGSFKVIDKKTLEFFGTLSLANNGGFASVRSKAKKLDLEKGDTLVAKVRGDGREYMLNLYPNKQRVAYSYRATVQTKKDEWIEVKLPLDNFEATSFGRSVKDAGPVKPEDIASLGFMLSDKKAGPFKLEIESIKVERAGK
jgi:NADH dehydrogenase [ubiquinone] 1 alpha subcomplex assembly factor 1